MRQLVNEKWENEEIDDPKAFALNLGSTPPDDRFGWSVVYVYGPNQEGLGLAWVHGDDDPIQQIDLHDVVELLEDLPQHKLKAGDIGGVTNIHPQTDTPWKVTFFDDFNAVKATVRLGYHQVRLCITQLLVQPAQPNFNFVRDEASTQEALLNWGHVSSVDTRS